MAWPARRTRTAALKTTTNAAAQEAKRKHHRHSAGIRTDAEGVGCIGNPILSMTSAVWGSSLGEWAFRESASRRGRSGGRVAAREGGAGEDGGEVVEAVAAMSAVGDGGDGEASFVGPAVDGFAAHAEEGGDLAGGEEQLLGGGGVAHGFCSFFQAATGAGLLTGASVIRLSVSTRWRSPGAKRCSTRKDRPPTFQSASPRRRAGSMAASVSVRPSSSRHRSTSLGGWA